MDDLYERQTSAFMAWFASQSGTTLHEHIALTDLRSQGAGRGIIAKHDIPADTVLFTIPRASVLTVETSALHAKEPSIFSYSTLAEPSPKHVNKDEDQDEDGDEDADSIPTAWLQLILALLHEHFLGPNSRWAPYLAVLPRTFDTPMYWTPAELAALDASSLRSKIGRASAERMFCTHLLPAIDAHRSVFFAGVARPPSAEELLELAFRMGSTIMAYAFDLKTDDDSSSDEDDEEQDGWVPDREAADVPLGMVPMADMLNADASFNAHVAHGADSLQVTAIRKIAAGEEILNYYGPLPTADLVRRYGYTTPLHARYDVVEIPWTIVVANMARIAAREEHHVRNVIEEIVGVPQDELAEGILLERDGEEGPDDEGRLREEIAPIGVPEEFREVVRPAISRLIGEKQAAKKAYWDVFALVMRERLEEYKWYEDDDERLLAETDSIRVRMAVQVRAGERTLLREAIAMAERKLAEIPHEGPPTKKQKR